MKKRRSIQALRHSLYSRKNSFNSFNNITDERYKEILEKVKKFLATVELESISPELYLYMDILTYITSPPITLDFSYDEKLIFLIEAIDPNLVILKTHKEHESVTALDLKKAKTATETNLMLMKKASESKQIEQIVRDQIKIYDRNLALYEKHYSAKIKNKKAFEEAPKKDLSQLILSNSSNIEFDNVEEKRFETINQKAQEWISITNSEGNHKRAAYNILYQNNILGLETKTEQIIFFILTTDPNLSALTIYFENGNWKQIKEEMILELGFFSKDLIKLEEKFHKRFSIQKSISDFAKLQKN